MISIYTAVHQEAFAMVKAGDTHTKQVKGNSYHDQEKYYKEHYGFKLNALATHLQNLFHKNNDPKPYLGLLYAP